MASHGQGYAKDKQNGGTHISKGGSMRHCRNGGLEEKFEGVCTIHAHLEALHELSFYIEPSNFEAGSFRGPTRVALNIYCS